MSCSRTTAAGSGIPGKALSLVIVTAEAEEEDEEESDSDEEKKSDKKKKKEKKAPQSLSTREAVSRSINAELLRSGLVRLDRPRFARNNASSSVPQHLSETLSALEEAQDAARRGRRGIWVYGDPGGDSDEDERRGGGGRRR